MAKYKRKSSIFEATQFTKDMAKGNNPPPKGIKSIEGKIPCINEPREPLYVIETTDGSGFNIQVGYWVIVSKEGCVFVCTNDYFQRKYEFIED